MATPTAATIATLRRMIADTTIPTYTDSILSAALAMYPLPDADGLDPDDTLWAGNWDTNQAAADIWEEKAAVFAADFDFSADGGDYKRSQAHKQMLDMARRYRAKRSSGTQILQAYPKPLGAVRLDSWIGNLSELATESDYE